MSIFVQNFPLTLNDSPQTEGAIIP